MPEAAAEEGSGGGARRASATIFTLGGIGAAFGTASCCGLPLLLASLGVSSAWLTGIALFAAPHRAILLLLGALCLAAGAVSLLWHRPTPVRDAGKAFPRTVAGGLIVVGLVLGCALLVIGYMYA